MPPLTPGKASQVVVPVAAHYFDIPPFLSPAFLSALNSGMFLLLGSW